MCIVDGLERLGNATRGWATKSVGCEGASDHVAQLGADRLVNVLIKLFMMRPCSCAVVSPRKGSRLCSIW